MAGVNAFSEPIVLLAGGRDKHLPWAEAAQLIMERVRELIVFGEMASLVQEAVEAQLSRSGDRVLEKIHHVKTLDEAVTTAAQVARSGEVVVLSPGGTSYDAFRICRTWGKVSRVGERVRKQAGRQVDQETSWRNSFRLLPSLQAAREVRLPGCHG
jgi:UDP-N-acetylmuramoylalanine--D-glutamate ligase